MQNKKVCFIFGTRPEAIKIAPISLLLQKDNHFNVVNISTGQHKEMLYQVVNFFKLPVDEELQLMQKNQSLDSLSASILLSVTQKLITLKPDIVLVQGDTTTASMGALAAFYLKIPVAHIEAGLRSNNINSPFPEEANRKIIAQIATLHFCPTQKTVKNLENEGITKNVYLVGNTVVDALLQGLKEIKSSNKKYFEEKFPMLNKKFILVTGHRRESFGEGMLNICKAIKQIATEFQDINIYYPVHLNPNVQEPVYSILAKTANVFLANPVSYADMIWLLNQCYIVLTDSGGVQEEAPSLGKPIVVMRDITERTEGIEAGNAVLVGTSEKAIYNSVKKLLTNEQDYSKMSSAGNPYGDGLASQRIHEILKDYFANNEN